MVKKLVLLAALVIALNGTAQAESVKFSLGAKTWLAEWETRTAEGDFRSRAGGMYGPVAILRYRSFFVGATYLTGGFKFPVDSNNNTDANRVDIDLTTGYYFNPYFGVTGGYKYIDFTFKFPSQFNLPDLKVDAEGPFAGVLGSYPLGRSGFLIYGNVTYAWLDAFDGPSGELGIAYRMPTIPVTFTEGFKYQKFKDRATGQSDIFSAIVFGVAYSF